MRQKTRNLNISIFTILFLTVGQISSAQHLFQVVSVDIKEQRLDEALVNISKQGKFFFSYSSNFIPSDSIVSVSAKNNTVKEVLDVLLNEKYEYKEYHNYIILRPAPNRLKLVPEEINDKDNWYHVSGFVINERTNEKVNNASVYEKRLLNSTLTNRDGYFKLKLKKTENEIVLTVSKELYRDFSLVILPSALVNPGGKDSGYNPYDDSDKVEKTVLGRLLISSRQKIQSLNLSGFFTNSPFQGSLTPGLSTHGIFNSQVVNKFSLNLAGGYTTGVEGLELAGGFNINKRSVRYVQAAGIFNVVGGSVKGVQLAGVNNTVFDSVSGVEAAGLYNHVDGVFSGVQLAGFANFNKKSVGYVQAAGAINVVGGAVDGVQLAGAANWVVDSVSGVQAAGALNEVKGAVDGAQIAGAFNRAKKGIAGIQIAGAGNVSGDITDGVQIAGLFNYSKNLQGVQIGIINLADSSDGVSIGLLNFIRGGYHKLSVFNNELLNTNVAFKTGNSKFYTVLIAGMNVSQNNKAYSFGMGIGHDFIINKNWLVSTELSSYGIYLGRLEEINTLQKVKTALQFRLTNGLSLFAGPTFNLHTDDNTPQVEGYKTLDPSYGLTFDFNDKLKGWVGLDVGITFF